MILPTSDESDRGEWDVHTVANGFLVSRLYSTIIYSEYSIAMYWSTAKRSTVVSSITPVLSTRYSPALSDFVWPSVRNSRPHYTRTIFEIYLSFCTSTHGGSGNPPPTAHPFGGSTKRERQIPTHTHNKHYSKIPVFGIHQHEALG